MRRGPSAGLRAPGVRVAGKDDLVTAARHAEELDLGQQQGVGCAGVLVKWTRAKPLCASSANLDPRKLGRWPLRTSLVVAVAMTSASAVRARCAVGYGC